MVKHGGGSIRQYYCSCSAKIEALVKTKSWLCKPDYPPSPHPVHYKQKVNLKFHLHYIVFFLVHFYLFVVTGYMVKGGAKF